MSKLCGTVSLLSSKKLSSNRINGIKAYDKKIKKGNKFASIYKNSDKKIDTKLIRKECIKAIRHEELHKKLKKAGVKIGSAVLIAGTCYYVKESGLAEVAAEKVKDKISQKFDEKFVEPINKKVEDAEKKIKQATDDAAAKIKQAADKVSSMVKMVVEHIKSLIKNIISRFKISILGYDKIENSEIMCKIDEKDDCLSISFKASAINKYIFVSKEFVTNATKYMGRDVKNGNVVDGDRDENGKLTRGGMIAAENSVKYRTNYIETFKNQLTSTFSEAFKLTKYDKGLGEFTKDIQEFKSKLDDVCRVTRQISETYKKSIDNQSSSNQQANEINKSIYDMLMNILTTSKDIIDTIDLIINYLEAYSSAAELSDTSIDDLIKSLDLDKDADLSKSSDLNKDMDIKDTDWD